jgi:hypothetical protein
MNVRDWLVETVNYYRQHGFFERYSGSSDHEVADALEALCREEGDYTGGVFTARGDWEVIRYDHQRVIEFQLDALYGDDPGSYRFDRAVNNLQKWADISRGVFQPVDMQDARDGLITATLNGEQATLKVWEDPYELASQLNSLILATGHQFEIWSMHPEAIVCLLTSDEKQKFQDERDWYFRRKRRS